MENERYIFNPEGIDNMIQIETDKIAPEGLGFGEGGISLSDRNNEISSEDLSQIETIVNSKDILVPVSTDKDGNMIDDDGCGDGRSVSRIFEGEEIRGKSLNRAKVFGGGAAMATSTLIGLGQAKGHTLSSTFSSGISLLRDKMVNFGAHTDTHAVHSQENSGCGAIDKAPIIVKNAVKFKEQIRSTIQALGIETTGLDEVEFAFSSYASDQMGEYTGADVMNEIIDNGKIVKELEDDHKEVLVILNTADNFTVDQDVIREATNKKAQAFAVDVWRLKVLADRLYVDQSDDVRHKAFLSELVYTLATAATLTKGDLPVYVISKKPAAVVI